ncbi:MAG: class I SAM-dependent methyltransferase [Betaproteobacteria bacterium]|nr:class I SAM-dependent methyltransferase [Betaproteobacteria bacterium]
MNTMTSAPTPDRFETVACYLCGARESTPLTEAEDDLTGKPGRFQFVTCKGCGLAFQNPRLKAEHIGSYYDDEYIAHRKKSDWGPLTPLYNWAMGKHDRDKLKLVERYLPLGSATRLLDIGCGAGTFLALARARRGAAVTGVDFKDLGGLPWMRDIEFRHGRLADQDFGSRRFDLVTMWHFLEHDYEPLATLARVRGLLAEEGRMVVEVPRLDSLSFRLYRERWPGLQAPQHTALYSRDRLLAMVDKAGFELLDYLPYGAFPPYFYLFTGLAFKLLKGRGLNLSRAIYPYFLGQALLAPLLLLQRHLNLAMHTVVCRVPR